MLVSPVVSSAHVISMVVGSTTMIESAIVFEGSELKLVGSIEALEMSADQVVSECVPSSTLADVIVMSDEAAGGPPPLRRR